MRLICGDTKVPLEVRSVEQISCRVLVLFWFSSAAVRRCGSNFAACAWHGSPATLIHVSVP